MRGLALVCAAALALALVNPAAAHCNYILEDGESLYSVSEGYGISWENITALNPQIEDPNLVYAGDVIRLPCDVDSESESSIAELLAHRSDTYYVYTAIVKAGLLEGLSKGHHAWTVFAPTDDAFEAFLEKSGANLTAVLADTKALTDVLAYHIDNKKALKADKLKNNQELPTMLEGQILEVSLDGKNVSIKTTSGQDAPVEVADLKGGRSVVHLVGEVLLPGEETPAPTPEPAPVGPPCSIVIKANDTVFDLAAKYNITQDAIVELNPSLEDNIDVLKIGQKLKLNKCSGDRRLRF